MLALGVAGAVGACGSSEPAKRPVPAKGPSRATYTAGLTDVERQLGCGILEVVEQQGDSERQIDRFLRRLGNAYAKASRRLSKLQPPADAVAPNANLAKALSNVADTLRTGVVALTDANGDIPPSAIEDTLLPPAAEKALDQLKARHYPSEFEASNCDDADLLSPTTKA